MSKGRPVGSKNKPKEKPMIISSSSKPTIKIDKKESEYSLIQKIRFVYRRHGVYGKSDDISGAIWKSGSYEAKNMALAIKAAREFVDIEGE